MEDYEIELELTKLMQELQQNSIVLETMLAPFSRLIENINKDVEHISKPFDEKTSKIEERIRELTLMRGRSLKTGSGNITYRKGGIRRSWDLDLLDEACERNEDVKNKIWVYRTETPTNPQVLIKVEKGGISVADI